MADINKTLLPLPKDERGFMDLLPSFIGTEFAKGLRRGEPPHPLIAVFPPFRYIHEHVAVVNSNVIV